MKSCLAFIALLSILFALTSCSESKPPQEKHQSATDGKLGLEPNEELIVYVDSKPLIVYGRDVSDWIESSPQNYCGRFEYDWSKPMVLTHSSYCLVLNSSSNGTIRATYEIDSESTPFTNLQISGNRFSCNEGHGRFVMVNGIPKKSPKDSTKRKYNEGRQTWLGMLFDMDVADDDKETKCCFWALRRVMVEGEYDNFQAMTVPETGDVGGIELMLSKKSGAYDIQISEAAESSDENKPQVRNVVVNEIMNTATFEFIWSSQVKEWTKANAEFVKEGVILKTKNTYENNIWFLPRRRGELDGQEVTYIVNQQTSLYDSARSERAIAMLRQYTSISDPSQDELGEDNPWSSVRLKKNGDVLKGYIPDSVISSGSWAITLEKTPLRATANDKGRLLETLNKHTVVCCYKDEGDFVFIKWGGQYGYIRNHAVSR